MTVNSSLNPHRFYGEWSGHPISDLQVVIDFFSREYPQKNRVWLAGDSSLDNKFWVQLAQSTPWRESVQNGWHELLPFMLPDVSYHINDLLVQSQKLNTVCINTSVEESILRQRLPKSLLKHDQLLRDNLKENDIIVVSIGGNDIALFPTVKSVVAILKLVGHGIWSDPAVASTHQLNTQQWDKIEKSWAFKHLVKLFKSDVEKYLMLLCEKCKPAFIVPCMIYYPQESSREKSWANFSLKCLLYNSKPWILQALIRRLFEKATCQIQLGDIPVKPIALFDALPGKPTDLYVARVEPSIAGGRKMAELIVRTLVKDQ